MNRVRCLGRRYFDGRRGAAAVLIAFLLFGFVVSAALLVDFSYMQLIRTELRTAADSAAKAGVEALARTQDSTAAINAAVSIAGQHKVGGRTFQIAASDVILGSATSQADGSVTFTANATPYSAVRVNAKVGNNGVTAALPTFFGTALGHGNFKTSQQATAAQSQVEVCLCLDLSGSMVFDMTGVDWSLPANNPLLYPSKYYPNNYWRYYCSPPHPTLSRWSQLMSSVTLFLDEVATFPNPPRTALVTWSSAYTQSYYPRLTYQTSVTDVALPAQSGFSWPTNLSLLNTALQSRSGLPMGGGTNFSAGLDNGVSILTGANSLPLGKKFIIMLTDGLWNEGRDPLVAAQDAAAANITVHCISMLTIQQSALEQVASVTGGQYYSTSSTTDLQQAFRELARSLSLSLID